MADTLLRESSRVELPRFVQIEPVGQCNLRCQMCPVQFRKDGPAHGVAFMEYAAFTSLIDELTGHVRELHLQGLGEPMMHPRLFEMIAYAVGKGIRVTSTSNLTVLSPRRAEMCVRSGLSELCVSIDSAIPEIYERIRVGSRLARVIRNLALLIETRERLCGTSATNSRGSDNGAIAGRDVERTPRIKFVAVLMKQTLAGLPQLVQLAHDWAIDELWVQHLCHDFAESSLPAEYASMRDFVNEQTLVGADHEQVEAVFDAVRAAGRELGVRVRLPTIRPNPHPPGTPGPARCDWPWARAYVSYQGLAMPCCTIATPDRFNFGSMKEQGVERIWNSPAYEDFRAQLSSDTPPDICRTCSVYQRTF